ncbi:hypothetical protein B9Z55_009179 [Caenorhabditis nigoni]|uniref:BTB domain-containing protein n=1 Tax=Caenorhabditis nigoni TaxID=1611254 RepID=A0A2G5UR71_9PELO|nr:hypothetical protein B9Z55_009179 [Caenorhabditis nigoni]
MDKPKEKEFMIRHVFSNMNRVLSRVMAPRAPQVSRKRGLRPRGEDRPIMGSVSGPTEMRYDIPWHLGMRDALFWQKFSLNCGLKTLKHRSAAQQHRWSIEADVEMKFVGKHGTFVEKASVEFNQYHADTDFMVELSEIQNCKDDDKLRVEWRVKINKMEGFEDEEDAEYPEDKPTVVLVVGKQKFEADKKFLADNCSYFRTLFFETSDEFGKDETEIDDCNSKDFENFLGILKGEQDIDHKSIDQVLELSARFGCNPMLTKCEEFLMKKSKKSIKIKFNLAIKYQLNNLKKKCLSDLKSKKELTEIGSENLDHFTAAVWKELFEKSISLN